MAQFTPRFPATLGGFDSRRTPALRTDVLIIGAGIAGSAAALAAAEAGASVLVLAKGSDEDTNTAWAQGGVSAVMHDDDSTALHVRDTLSVGAGTADLEVAEDVVRESAGVIAWLQAIGVEFDRDPDGQMLLSREGGHSVDRVVHHGDATGAAIQHALVRAVETHGNITRRTGVFVRDLLVHDGRCNGALVMVDGTTLAIEARAVVLATGGAGQIYRETTNPIGACGDGAALCFRAGAALADLEFVQFHPTTLYIAGASRFLISEVVRGAGARLVDRDGVRFMLDHHPAGELAPRDVVSRAILERMVQTGDTHVYLDLSGIGEAAHLRFPTISRICSAFDLDIQSDPIPVRPGAHYFIGGASTDRDGASTVPGLWVAGEAACTGLHGANRLASNSLLEGAVFGQRAGIAAAHAARQPGPPLPHAIADPNGTDNAPRLQLDDMLYSLKSLMWRNVGLARTAEGLDEAAHRIGLWHHYLMRGPRHTIRALELANMLTVSSLVAHAASRRAESRGTHYRADHTQRDDQQWCRRLVLSRAADGSITSTLGPALPPTDKLPT